MWRSGQSLLGSIPPVLRWVVLHRAIPASTLPLQQALSAIMVCWNSFLSFLFLTFCFPFLRCSLSLSVLRREAAG